MWAACIGRKGFREYMDTYDWQQLHGLALLHWQIYSTKKSLFTEHMISCAFLQDAGYLRTGVVDTVVGSPLPTLPVSGCPDGDCLTN